MSILCISYNIYPCRTGGAEIFNYHLIKALSSNNKLIVLTNCKKYIESDKIKVYYIKKIKPVSVFVPLQILIKVLILKKRIKVIHLSYMRTSWMHWIIYPLINVLLGINYVLTIHGGALHQWKPKWPHYLLFKRALHITAASNRVKVEYEKRSNRNLIFTPPLIPFQISSNNTRTIKNIYKINAFAKVILYVGSIKPLKGTITLLEAFAKLGKHFIESNNLMLLIAGDGQDKKKLEDEYKKSFINSNLIFLGNISNNRISDLYKIADIYVITSDLENTPISMLEAMFNSLPIIGSNVPGINNIIEHYKNGLLYEHRNSSDLAKKITNLVENPLIADQLKRNGKSYYDNFYNYNDLLITYDKILNNTKITETKDI